MTPINVNRFNGMSGNRYRLFIWVTPDTVNYHRREELIGLIWQQICHFFFYDSMTRLLCLYFKENEQFLSYSLIFRIILLSERIHCCKQNHRRLPRRIKILQPDWDLISRFLSLSLSEGFPLNWPELDQFLDIRVNSHNFFDKFAVHPRELLITLYIIADHPPRSQLTADASADVFSWTLLITDLPLNVIN